MAKRRQKVLQYFILQLHTYSSLASRALAEGSRLFPVIDLSHHHKSLSSWFGLFVPALAQALLSALSSCQEWKWFSPPFHIAMFLGSRPFSARPYRPHRISGVIGPYRALNVNTVLARFWEIYDGSRFWWGCWYFSIKLLTRSQAVARIADRTASSTFGGHVTSSVTWP